MDVQTIQIIITAIVAPIVTYGAKKIIDKLFKKETDETAIVMPKLKEHPFFERMKVLRSSVLFSFELKNKGKEAIFRDILVHKLDIFIEKMWQVCLKLDESDESMSDTAFYNYVTDNFREALKEFSKYYEAEGYTEDEKVCIGIVLQKFNKWNNSRMQCIMNSIDLIASSQFFTTSTLKMASILDMMLGQFVDTINDAQLTLNELNGDLKGLTFKNIKI